MVLVALVEALRDVTQYVFVTVHQAFPLALHRPQDLIPGVTGEGIEATSQHVAVVHAAHAHKHQHCEPHATRLVQPRLATVYTHAGLLVSGEPDRTLVL